MCVHYIDEYGQSTVADDPELQIQLVELMVKYGGMVNAAQWSLHYGLPKDRLPFGVWDTQESLPPSLRYRDVERMKENKCNLSVNLRLCVVRCPHTHTHTLFLIYSFIQSSASSSGRYLKAAMLSRGTRPRHTVIGSTSCQSPGTMSTSWRPWRGYSAAETQCYRYQSNREVVPQMTPHWLVCVCMYTTALSF